MSGSQPDSPSHSFVGVSFFPAQSLTHTHTHRSLFSFFIIGVDSSNRIFELAPAARKLFAFTKSLAVDSDDELLYQNPLFLRHARGVVHMLDTAISLLGPAPQNWNALHRVLHDLGARHIEYGVVPAQYPIVGQALLYTLQTALGSSNRWTPEVEQGWTSIYELISSSMLQGAHERIHMEHQARDKTNKSNNNNNNGEAQRNDKVAQHGKSKKAFEVVPLPPGVAPKQQLKQHHHQQGTDSTRTIPQAKKVEDIRGAVRNLRLQRRRASMSSLVSSPDIPIAAEDKVTGLLDKALNISLSTTNVGTTCDSVVSSTTTTKTASARGGGLSSAIASKLKISSAVRDKTRSNKSTISLSLNSRANRHHS
jgi:hypothetical protein